MPKNSFDDLPPDPRIAMRAVLNPHRRDLSRAIAALVPVREAIKADGKKCNECGHFHFDPTQQAVFSAIRRTIKQLDDLLMRAGLPYDPT